MTSHAAAVAACLLLGAMLPPTLGFHKPRLVGKPSPRYQVENLPSVGYHTSAQGSSRSPAGPLRVMTDREPDILEMMMGGERYEMVPLPDRMCDTTIFVGNLCEFVHDEDLSDLFQTVSSLQSLPACVVRKANMQSKGFGFVSFLTVQEKEAAILRFHGREWRGKRIKVECIRDNPKCGRVRVPERMVSYVSGAIKKTRDGKVNSMRTARDGDAQSGGKKRRKKQKASLKRKAKQKGKVVGFRLSQSEQQELLRACKHGYLTLDGRNAGHGSLANLCSSEALKGSKMAMAHREWADERAKPNIILYKASGRHTREVLDHVVVDLSPLRDQMSSKWTREVLNAAAHAGMDLQAKEDTEECELEPDSSDNDDSDLHKVYSDSLGPREPISGLPFISLGFFVGERSKAKAMAKELAQMWQLPEVEEMNEAGEDDTRVPHGEGGRYQNSHGRTGKKNDAKDRRAKRRRIKRDDWEQSMGRYLRY